MRATDLRVSLARQTPGFPWIRGASFWRFAHVKVAHKRSKTQGNPGVCPAKETLRSVALIFGFLNLLLNIFLRFLKDGQLQKASRLENYTKTLHF